MQDFLGETKVPLSEYLNHGPRDIWAQLQEKVSGIKGIAKAFIPQRRGTETWKRVQGELHLIISFSSSMARKRS
jgi:hypothetical protein